MDVPFFESVDAPWRRRPADYIPGRGWYQGGERLRRVKPHYHFIWPKDGKRGTTWGRWKDIAQGTGPDIHVTIGADKNDHMYHRQRKARWSRWTHLDDRDPDRALNYKPPWVRYNRWPGKRYDFNTRTYRKPDRNTWTDALWQEEPNDGFCYPYALRDRDGEWFQDTPWWQDPMDDFFN